MSSSNLSTSSFFWFYFESIYCVSSWLLPVESLLSDSRYFYFLIHLVFKTWLYCSKTLSSLSLSLFLVTKYLFRPDSASLKLYCNNLKWGESYFNLIKFFIHKINYVTNHFSLLFHLNSSLQGKRLTYSLILVAYKFFKLSFSMPRSSARVFNR